MQNNEKPEGQENMEVSFAPLSPILSTQATYKTTFFWWSFAVYILLIVASVCGIFSKFPPSEAIQKPEDLWKIVVHLVHWSPLYIVLWLSIKKLLHTISILEHYKKTETLYQALSDEALYDLPEEHEVSLRVAYIKSLQPKHPDFNDEQKNKAKADKDDSIELLKNLNALIGELKQLINHLKSK
jgi:hypothetical protein